MIGFLRRKGAAADIGGEVTVAHTHLFRGATGTLPDREIPAGGMPVAVEFSDGMVASGRLLAMAAGRTRLEVETFRTSKGAKIGPKAWILEPHPEEPGQFYVRASGD